jgi:hypothetical protein
MKHRRRTVHLSEIKHDPAVNRPLDKAWVDRLVKNWRDESMGIPVLSDRGNYYVPLDGQHRIEALRQQTPLDRRLDAEVYSELTVEQEAALFLDLNFSRAVRPFDKFQKLVTSGDADACAIQSIVQEMGLRIESGARPAAVAAVVVLQRLFSWDRKGTLLRSVLETSKSTWGTDGSSFQGEILSGLGTFFRSFPDAEIARTRRVLAQAAGGASGLLGRGRTIREMRGGTIGGGVAEAIRALYNKGLRHKLGDPA